MTIYLINKFSILVLGSILMANIVVFVLLITVIYNYTNKFRTFITECLVNRGLVCSLLKNSAPSFCSSNSLTQAHVLNLSRYASLSPKSILKYFFWSLSKGKSLLFVTPHHTVIP